MRENVRQLPDLVRLAHRLGVEGVTGCHLFAHAYMGIDSSCFWNQPEYDKMLAKTIAAAKCLNSFFYGPQPFSVPGGASDITAESGPGLCDYPEYGTYINPDGTVMPCCAAPIHALGNVNTQSFAEIWNDHAYQLLRATYRTDKPSLSRCKNCLVKKDQSQDYASYFAPDHWQAVRKRIAAASIKN
jgi:radical SAM protein with 4Fe4S-binding SPASM domain